MSATLDMAQKSIDLWSMRFRAFASLLAVFLVAVMAAWTSSRAVAYEPSAHLLSLGASDAVGIAFNAQRSDAPVKVHAHTAGAHDHAGHGSHDHVPGQDHQSCPDCSCCSCAGASHFLPAHVRPGIVDGSAPRLFCAFDDAARHLGVRFSLLRPPRIPV